jgi:hypothetical protein
MPYEPMRTAKDTLEAEVATLRLEVERLRARGVGAAMAEIPVAVRQALERLHNEMLHDQKCPTPDRPCTCQHFADLALVTEALDAGARTGGERALRELIEPLLVPYIPNYDIRGLVVGDIARAVLLPPAAPERGEGG